MLYKRVIVLLFCTFSLLLNAQNQTSFGHFYIDNNRNEIQDNNEVSLKNVKFLAKDAAQNIKIIQTDDLGNWQIQNFNAVKIAIQHENISFNKNISNQSNVGNIGLTNNSTNSLFLVGQLHGHVYADTNGNGVQDGVEPDLNNKDVLINYSGGGFQLETTNGNGDWFANNVPSGGVTITLDASDLPVGYIQTEGTNPNSVTVVDGQDIDGGTDGIHYRGELTGHLYKDTNGNGTQQGSEPDLPNISITLQDDFGNASQVISTDTNGDWSIQMAVTDITVTVDVNDVDFPIGATQTEGSNPSIHTVVVAVSTFTENDGYFENGTIIGHLYNDLDGNGTQNAGENDLANITITILDSLGNTTTVNTNATGDFSAIIPSGSATITIDTTDTDMPSGAVQTEGANPNNIIVTTGQTEDIGNNGFYNRGTLTGHLYYDLNQNGSQSSDEPNMANVDINITDAEMNTYTVTTDAQGDWSVIVSAGNASSEIDVTDTDFPATYTQTEGTNPTTTLVITNQITLSDNDGFYSEDDTDGDGVFNALELSNNTDPSNPCEPIQAIGYTGYDNTNTIWANADCDGDGVLNGIEHNTTSGPYNPCTPTQNAGYTSYDNTNLTWLNSDCDGDSILNGNEDTNGTDPYNTDTDGDGITDDVDAANALDPCLPAQNEGYTGYDNTNAIWIAADCDGDSILNGDEDTAGTDPYSNDSDGDGVPDNTDSAPADSCMPIQNPGYTGYDNTNTNWTAADCDGDSILNGNEDTNGTDPYNTDTDGDGVTDDVDATDALDPCLPAQNEGYTGYDNTNAIWIAADCDGDSILNGDEDTAGTDPYSNDSDGDGVPDDIDSDPTDSCMPIQNPGYTGYDNTNTNWIAADCDGDSILNGDEDNAGTDPYNTDTDGDGVTDDVDATDALDPCLLAQNAGYTGYDNTNAIWIAADCDGDSVTNGDEDTAGTDPYGNDSDGDGVSDDIDSDPTDSCMPIQNPGYTGYDNTNANWIAADCDGDSILNGDEDTVGTDPYNTDTDGDGISDGDENTNTTDPLDACDPNQDANYTDYDTTNLIWQNADCDGDGITNGDEITANTNPNDTCDPEQNPGYTGYDSSNINWQNADCDGDGVINIDEVNESTDPYDVSDNTFEVFNSLTPNNDGDNDVFYIANVDRIPNNEMQIVNRWGVLVYSEKNYNNTTVAFKGISEGRITISKNVKLPAGTYFYKFTYVDTQGKDQVKAGYLYIE